MNQPRTAESARRTLIAVIAALTVASIAFRILTDTMLEHTSLLFIGIPALLSLALVGVQPTTTTGTIQKTIALALCMSGIAFGEGFVCIVFASPLFFAVGGLVGWLQGRKSRGDDSSPTSSLKRLGIVLLVPMSLEGVLPHFELPRDEIVTVSRVVPATAGAVRAALAGPMRFDQPLPLFFRLGFPTTGATAGTGLAVGDRRSAQFQHGGHHPGALVLEVTSSGPHAVVFSAVSDDSYITHWLSWRSAEVSWSEVAAGQTQVTWTLHYRRRLDPAWYFKPLERYGVSLAAAYLIETLATPDGAIGH